MHQHKRNLRPQIHKFLQLLLLQIHLERYVRVSGQIILSRHYWRLDKHSSNRLRESLRQGKEFGCLQKSRQERALLTIS